MTYQEIAQTYSTPTYVYDAQNIRSQYRALSDACADVRIAYAVKSNSALGVMKVLFGEGAGADIVSGGELYACLKAGVAPSKIVFSGVGKTDCELSSAIDAKIGQINVESAPELERISKIAASKGVKANVVFRLNPDVEKATLDKISTGSRHNKFGVLEDDLIALYANAQSDENINALGVSVHIGSQILKLSAFEQSFKTLAKLILKLRSLGMKVSVADLGGGIGIEYSSDDVQPSLVEYGALIDKIIRPLDVKITLEPGRLLVGHCGRLLTRVVHVKHSAGRRIVVVDAGMSTFMRCAIYGAFHEITALNPRKGDVSPCDIVGPICESSDIFAKDFPMPPLQAGDILTINDVGAHGSVLASTYNMYTLPAEVLIDGEKSALLRPRQTIEELISRDKIPNWL